MSEDLLANIPIMCALDWSGATHALVHALVTKDDEGVLKGMCHLCGGGKYGGKYESCFSVSRMKNFFFCAKCHREGNALDFIFFWLQHSNPRVTRDEAERWVLAKFRVEQRK